MSLPQWFPRLASTSAAVVLLAAFTIVGCSDDDNPVDDGGNGEPTFTASRTTAQELMEAWFSQAYNQEDNARYQEMLHEDYEFRFWSGDVDSLGEELTRAQDIASTGNMFANAEVLNLGFVSSWNGIASTDCDGCFEWNPTISLTIAAPPDTFTVNSRQVFVVAPDPDSAGLWVLWRQIDEEPFGKQPSSVEQASWGQIKHRFLP